MLQGDKDFIVNLLEEQLSHPKDPPTYVSDAFVKQLETGDYGASLENINEMNDAVFTPLVQARQLNNNNNTRPAELFDPGNPMPLATDIFSPPLFPANGEITSRPD